MPSVGAQPKKTIPKVSDPLAADLGMFAQDVCRAPEHSLAANGRALQDFCWVALPLPHEEFVLTIVAYTKYAIDGNVGRLSRRAELQKVESAAT